MRLSATVRCERGTMSDSGGSAESVRGSDKLETRKETTAPLSNPQDPNGDKLEEFEKLLQSMMPSRSPSEEKEDAEENGTERKIGASFCTKVSEQLAGYVFNVNYSNVRGTKLRRTIFTSSPLVVPSIARRSLNQCGILGGVCIG